MGCVVWRIFAWLWEAIMAMFSVNTHRFDPYKNFKFRVKWEGRYVAGICRVGPLRRATEVVEHRDGGEPSVPRKAPGITRYEPIRLERGVTHPVEFEQCANMGYNLESGHGSEVSLADFRKDILIELYNEAGQLVKSFIRVQVLAFRILSHSRAGFER